MIIIDPDFDSEELVVMYCKHCDEEYQYPEDIGICLICLTPFPIDETEGE